MQVDQTIIHDKEAKAMKLTQIKEYARNFFVGGKY